MEAGLLVIGLNHRTALLAVRERFWLSDNRMPEAMLMLARGEGVEEAAIICTPNRTEYVVWASDISSAASSIQTSLTQRNGLRLSDWKDFYRLSDQGALAHVFRVTSGLDSIAAIEGDVTAQVAAAWNQAKDVGTAGRRLKTVFIEALDTAKRIAAEGSPGIPVQSVGNAVGELVHRTVGDVAKRRVLMIGTGRLGKLSVGFLGREGADVRVTDLSPTRAKEIAQAVAGTPCSFDQRCAEIAASDVVVSCTHSPHIILTRETIEAAQGRRKNRRLCLLDLAMPRDIDCTARQIEGVLLYDLDDVERAIENERISRSHVLSCHEDIVLEAARRVHTKLAAEEAVPPAAAFRGRLEEICRQECQLLTRDMGPFSEEHGRRLEELSARLVQRIAGEMEGDMNAPRRDEHTIASTLRRLLSRDSRRGIAAPSR